MKFSFVIEDGRRSIILKPENDGEKQMLAALHPHQDTSAHDIDAVAWAEQTGDRPRKIIALHIEIRGN